MAATWSPFGMSMQPNARVLLLEGIALGGRELTELLSNFDYQVTVVHTPDELLGAVGDSDVAAAIVDLTGGEADGLNVIQQLRNSSGAGRSELPIIAITTKSTGEHRRISITAGANDCLSKPFDPEEVRRILLRWTYRSDHPNLKLLKRTNPA
jgi:DNA-binding response OmpR family regulator